MPFENPVEPQQSTTAEGEATPTTPQGTENTAEAVRGQTRKNRKDKTASLFLPKAKALQDFFRLVDDRMAHGLDPALGQRLKAALSRKRPEPASPSTCPIEKARDDRLLSNPIYEPEGRYGVLVTWEPQRLDSHASYLERLRRPYALPFASNWIRNKPQKPSFTPMAWRCLPPDEMASAVSAHTDGSAGKAAQRLDIWGSGNAHLEAMLQITPDDKQLGFRPLSQTSPGGTGVLWVIPKGSWCLGLMKPDPQGTVKLELISIAACSVDAKNEMRITPEIYVADGGLEKRPDGFRKSNYASCGFDLAQVKIDGVEMPDISMGALLFPLDIKEDGTLRVAKSRLHPLFHSPNAGAAFADHVQLRFLLALKKAVDGVLSMPEGNVAEFVAALSKRVQFMGAEQRKAKAKMP